MTTMQCPKCQLRFVTRSEVLSHLRMDHRRTTGRACRTGCVGRPTGAFR